jgi:hypothetical protein
MGPTETAQEDEVAFFCIFPSCANTVQALRRVPGTVRFRISFVMSASSVPSLRIGRMSENFRSCISAAVTIPSVENQDKIRSSLLIASFSVL